MPMSLTSVAGKVLVKNVNDKISQFLEGKQYHNSDLEPTKHCMSAF